MELGNQVESFEKKKDYLPIRALSPLVMFRRRTRGVFPTVSPLSVTINSRDIVCKLFGFPMNVAVISIKGKLG